MVQSVPLRITFNILAPIASQATAKAVYLVVSSHIESSTSRLKPPHLHVHGIVHEIVAVRPWRNRALHKNLGGIGMVNGAFRFTISGESRIIRPTQVEVPNSAVPISLNQLRTLGAVF